MKKFKGIDMIKPYLTGALLALCAALALPAQADVLLVESIESAPSVTTPRQGSNMDQVRTQFGNPEHVLPAVGEPPITRWDYPGFSVFFEHDLALHSVVHHVASH